MPPPPRLTSARLQRDKLLPVSPYVYCKTSFTFTAQFTTPPVQGRAFTRRLHCLATGQTSRGLMAFCETTYNICVKIQQTTVAVTPCDILNNITSKILHGGHYHGCSPFINIGGTCPPPCPIGIDAPAPHEWKLSRGVGPAYLVTYFKLLQYGKLEYYIM